MTRNSIRGSSDRSILILTSLADGPKHGYALIQDIEGFAGVRLGAGTLYGALAKLERAGLVEALPPGDRRRPYQITVAGREELRARLLQAARDRRGGPAADRGGHAMNGGPVRAARRAVPAGLAGPLRRRGRRAWPRN